MRLSDRVPCDNHLLIYQMTVLSSIVTHPPTSLHLTPTSPPPPPAPLRQLDWRVHSVQPWDIPADVDVARRVPGERGSPHPQASAVM